MLKREDVEAFLCSHSFSFMVDILSDFIWDITEAVSDSDQLSKGCLKVKERETFICDLLHQCQCCNTGEQSPAWKEMVLSGDWWPGLPAAMCQILGQNTCADSLCIPKSFSKCSWCRVKQWRSTAGCTCDCDFCFPGVHPGLLSLLLPKSLVKD